MTNRLRGSLIVGLAVAATSLAASESPSPVVQPSATAAVTVDGKVVPPRWLQRVPTGSFPFIVVTDPKTGKTCQVMPHSDCSATAEIVPGPRLVPDVEGLQIVLLQSLAAKLEKSIRSPTRWYVTVTSADNVKGDPSPVVIGFVHLWNVSIEGGSRFPGDNVFLNTAPGTVMHYTIGAPERRPDGTYIVGYSYYCGAGCAASFTAVMSNDARGWHIVSTTPGTTA